MQQRSDFARAAIALSAALALTGSPTLSQTKPAPLPAGMPEATIYRDAGYRGPAVAISYEQPNLGLTWRVNSIRVKSGRWQLCEQSYYRGNCRTVERDTPLLGLPGRGMAVQSVREIGGGYVPAPIGDGGPSLRGIAAQFYTQPSEYGQRVLACTTGSATSRCAAQTADRFCKNMGWTASANERLETVNRQVYLADVLCTRTGY